MESKQSYISLRHIDKVYDNNVQAVFDFNLDINEHEFIIFVGPSGCGKSTTLRMVAGLEEITEGELYIDGRLVNDVHPKDRDIAMVFQSYALYPHMSVYENMAFGLRIKRIPRAEIDQRIQKAAEILGLTPYLKRKPKALSGGQRQRVALGRAIVREPRVFLMDEPLSNLDAKLRVQMRSEITKIHKNVGATTIYVTHDQTEAMTMGDRIVVMKDGYVQQIGTPNEIYTNPKNIFVATFIGSPAMNILTANYDKGLVTLTNGFAKQLTKEEIAKHDAFYVKFKDEVLGKIEKNNKFIEFKVERYTKPALYKLKNQYVDVKESFDFKILVEKNKVRKYKEKILANEGNETLIANLEGAIAEQEAIIEQIKENQKAALAEIEARVAALDAELSAEIDAKGISEETQVKIDTLLGKDKEYQAALEEAERLNNLLAKIEGIIAGNPHNVKLGVRPEDIYLQNDANKENPSPEFSSVCDVCELLGHEKIVYSYYNDEQIIVKINAKWDIQTGDRLVYSANLEKVHIFDEDNTVNILFEEK